MPRHARTLAAALALALCQTLMAQAPAPQGSWTVVDDATAVSRWTENGRPYFAVSIDGGRTRSTAVAADYNLMLRYRAFDPKDGEPVVARALTARADAKLFIVQYFTDDLSGYRRILDDLGVERLHHLHNYGVLVRCDAGRAAAIAAMPHVRWVGPYHPAYRIDEVMLAEAERAALPTRWYNLLVTKRGPVEKEAVRARVLELGGDADSDLEAPNFLMRVRLDGAGLLDIVGRDDVLFVDRWSAPEQDMDVARNLGGANYIETNLGFTGQGVRGEVMDGGLLTTHVDFQTPAPIQHTAVGVDSHGTATFGIIFGDGIADPVGRGMIPDATGIIASYNAFSNRYTHTQQLTQPPYEAVFQSNSWGDALTTAYTTISADMDTIIFDLDFVICNSQSNAGTQQSRPQAWAKNIVSVGGIKHMNTLATADDNWTNGASIGPAADGRIKPEICSFYDNIRTTTSTNNTAYTSTFGGTSGATPIVAGHFGIMFQMWGAGLFPVVIPAPGGTVFQNRPHFSTAKALMLNTTTQYPFTGTTSDLTRVHQGWGYPSLQTLHDQRTRLFIVDETDVLSNLQTATYILNVTPTDPEFRATLVYADPPANPASTIARINDLTLKVTSPAGTIYWGNNGLTAGTASVAGGSASTVDTVEQVIVPSPQAGAWTVEVIASSVVQDGHVETPQVDADFALVVRGVDPPSTGGTPDVGQANQSGALLNVSGATNINGQPAIVGINGPFAASRGVGSSLAFNVTSAANRSMLLLYGGLNRNNFVSPIFGSLDLGFNGATLNFGDVAIVIDGLTPDSFLDQLGVIGSSGSQSIGFTVPQGMPPGVFGTFQALIVNPANTVDSKFTAAFEITIN